MDEAKLHVYNMRMLPKEVRKMFCSDMRLIVDYLAEGTEYIPTGQRIVHIEALLNMMHEITGDERYMKIVDNALRAEQEGEKVTMCEILDGFIEKGISQGENLLASLMSCLFTDNRLEDAKIASTDEKRRKELYREYGLV